MDGDVDVTDFGRIVRNFDPSGTNAPNSWSVANFDGDNDVDIVDFNALAMTFGNVHPENPENVEGLVLYVLDDDAVGTNNEAITAWPARVGVDMSSGPNNPYLVRNAFGPYAGMKFAKGEVATFDAAALRITGDISVYSVWSTVKYHHQFTTGNLYSTGDSTDGDGAVNKIYDVRITRGDMFGFWEFGTGSNEGLHDSMLPVPFSPMISGMRRDVSADQVTYRVDGNENTVNYTHDPSGGSASEFYIGANSADPGLALGGILAELMIFDRKLTDLEDAAIQSITAVGNNIYFTGHGASASGTMIYRGRLQDDELLIDYSDQISRNIAGFFYNDGTMYLLNRDSSATVRLHNAFSET